MMKSFSYYIATARLYIRILGWTGFARVVKAKWFSGQNTIVIRKTGVKFPLTLRIPSTDIDAYDQVFEKGEYDFQVSTPPMVIVDAGANVGMASIYFANKYPDAKIIAIEPEQSNFDLLVRNTAPYEKIISEQAALWNTNGSVKIVDPGFGNWAFRTEASGMDKSNKDDGGQIRSVTVETIMREHKLPKIDILKIDIEGAEKEVFDDASQWIEKIDCLIVEIHEGMKAGCHVAVNNAAMGFQHRWRQGENNYFSRSNFSKNKASLG